MNTLIWIDHLRISKTNDVASIVADYSANLFIIIFKITSFNNNNSNSDTKYMANRSDTITDMYNNNQTKSIHYYFKHFELVNWTPVCHFWAWFGLFGGENIIYYYFINSLTGQKICSICINLHWFFARRA